MIRIKKASVTEIKIMYVCNIVRRIAEVYESYIFRSTVIYFFN